MGSQNINLKDEKRPFVLSKKLDSFFKVSAQGSTVSQEISAGIGAFCVAVCALLMNTQIIGTSYGNYAGAYFATSLIVFAGTILMGIICNLPLIQCANMGMSTVVITMMSTNSGLSYANLMFVTFIAAIIYLVIILTPLKKIFIDSLPEGVKKALPAGIGLYVAWTAIKNTGLLTAEGTLEKVSDLGTLDTFYFWLLIAGILLFVFYMAIKRRNALGSTYFLLIAAMWVCGIIFYMENFIGGQTATTLVYQRVNLIIATDGAAPYNIANGIASLDVGALFRQGMDFSAFTEAGGNLPLFIAETVMTFVFLGMYTNFGTMHASAVAGDIDEGWNKKEGKVLITGAALNIISPILGTTPTSIGPQSAIGTRDGAKTGLSSLACGIGFAIALFNWVFFAIFATSTNGVGMWINDTETKLAAYVQDSFVFADLIMVFVGLSMLKAVRFLDTKKSEEFIPFVAALSGMAFFGDITIGIAFGTVLYCIFKAIDKTRSELKLSTIILAVILLIYAYIALKYGGNFVTAVSGGMMGAGPGGM